MMRFFNVSVSKILEVHNTSYIGLVRFVVNSIPFMLYNSSNPIVLICGEPEQDGIHPWVPQLHGWEFDHLTVNDPACGAKIHIQLLSNPLSSRHWLQHEQAQAV